MHLYKSEFFVNQISDTVNTSMNGMTDSADNFTQI